MSILPAISLSSFNVRCTIFICLRKKNFFFVRQQINNDSLLCLGKNFWQYITKYKWKTLIIGRIKITATTFFTLTFILIWPWSETIYTLLIICVKSFGYVITIKSTIGFYWLVIIFWFASWLFFYVLLDTFRIECIMRRAIMQYC